MLFRYTFTYNREAESLLKHTFKIIESENVLLGHTICCTESEKSHSIVHRRSNLRVDTVNKTHNSVRQIYIYAFRYTFSVLVAQFSMYLRLDTVDKTHNVSVT